MRGITPVARLYEAVNAERVAVAAASVPRSRTWPIGLSSIATTQSFAHWPLALRAEQQHEKR